MQGRRWLRIGTVGLAACLLSGCLRAVLSPKAENRARMFPSNWHRVPWPKPNGSMSRYPIISFLSLPLPGPICKLRQCRSNGSNFHRTQESQPPANL